MLSLKFRCVGESRTADPAEWIEFRGVLVCISGHCGPIAQYASGHWLYAGMRSSYFECRAMLFIHFEDPDLQRRCVLGPYPSLRVRDRYLFGGRTPIATLTPSTGRWLQRGTSETWQLIRVLPDTRTL